MKKTKINCFLLLALLSLSMASFGQGQNIDIRFLNAKFTRTGPAKDLMAVFLVSTRDSMNFPPAINLPPKMTVFENGFEKVFILAPNNLGLSMDDHLIAQKNPAIYALIKDKVDLKKLKNSMIITYKISGVNYDFKRMTLTPAFKEKHNQNIKVDKRFEFDVAD